MRNILLHLSGIALIAAACGQGGSDLEAKKQELADHKTELRELQTKIKELEKEIAELDTTAADETKRNSTLVTTIKSAIVPFEHKVEVRGAVMSRTNINIGSEVMGQLKSVNIKEGEKVQKGQILAVVDSDNLRRTMNEVRTQLDFATTVYEKRARLWKQNIGSELEYLQAKNNKEALEKQLETLNSQLNKMQIKAPQAGTVEAVPVKTGEIIQPGTPIAFLVSNADMYIKAEVSEPFIGKFNVGDSVEVSIPSLHESFNSSIISIGKVINPASRTFSVEVKLPKVEEYLKANLVTVLKLTDYKTDSAVVVPAKLIQEDKLGNFVYSIHKNKATKKHIDLGLSYDHQIEVLKGLKGNETIIDKGSRLVSEGSDVSVQN